MHTMATDDESGGERPAMGVIEGGGAGGLKMTQFLQRIQYGEFNEALSRDLAEMGEALTQYVENYNGEPTGQIDITLKFKMKKGVVEVTAEKKLKTPKMPSHGGVFYLNARGQLVEDDPRQMSMFPRGPRSV
jgi:hypothetical protein